MSGHKINPSSPTPLHGIEREGHIDEAAARRISVARLSINPDVEQKLEEVMTRVRRKNYDKDDKTRWGSLRKQFHEHGSTGFHPKLTEENSFELEQATNNKYQYNPGGKPRQTSPNHDADSGYNEERASPRYHTPDAQPVPKPATPVKKSEPAVVNATLEQLRRGSLFRGEKPITEKPHNAWQGLLARHQERAGKPGKHVTIKTGKPDEVEPPPRAPREAHRGPNERPPEKQTDGPSQGLHPARRSPPPGRRPSPNRRPSSPGRRSRSPNRPVASPRGRRPSPNRQPGSPTGRRRSPNRPGSPAGRRRSPNRPGSPAGRRRSPNRPSGSPDRRRRSPNRAGSPRRGNWPATRKLVGSPRGGRRWPSPQRQGDGSRGRSRSPNLAPGPPNQRGRSPNRRTGYPNELYDSPSGQRRNHPRDEGLSSAERRRQSMPEGKNNDHHDPDDNPRRQSIPSHGNHRPPDRRNPNSKAEVWNAEHPDDRMDDGRLIRSPPSSRPASSERRITPVEEVEPGVSSPTGLISAMKPTDGRRRPTPNKKPRKSVVFVDPIPMAMEDVQQEKDNRPPSSKDPVQPALHQPAKDQGPLPSTSAAFLGNPTEYGKENRPTSAKQPAQPQPNKPSQQIASTTDSNNNDAPKQGQENTPPKAKSPVPPSAKSPVPPKVKSPVPPNAPQPTKAPQPIASTSGSQNNHAPKPGQERLPSAAKPPEIRTTSPPIKVPTAVSPPKNKEEPASVKTVDETKKDGPFHDLQKDLAPPKKEPSTSNTKQSQSAASQKLTPETPANSAQKNPTIPTPEVTQAQQKDANAKAAAATGPVKAKSPKPKLQPPLQENGSVSKKKPSFSEKKYQTTDEPVKTAEVKPLERKLERKDTAQVLKDKDMNMDTEFLDDRKGSGKTLIKDRPAKKKGDWMASKKTQGTSKRHGKKKAASRKDAHIQELSGTEKACYTCAGYCMCCACCYRLFKDDDDDEVFRRRKCITVFLAIALAIVLVGLIIGLCIGLGGLGGPAPTSPPRFILVPQNLNPVVVNGNQNQPVSAGTPAGGTGTAAGTANGSTATDGATPGGTTG